MVEHGNPVDLVIEQLIKDGVGERDIIIDGGNSYYKDSVQRYEKLKKKGIDFLDIGTSGGLEGARNGACIMVGGDEKVFHIVKSMLEKISEPGGVAYFGPSGAGHFVKMIHNGIEYGMLQAIGEGFEILEKGPYKLDLHQIAFNYTRGSVVRGWLMDLLEKALKSDPKLERLEGVVGGGSTGEWTLKTAYELGVDVPVIAKSLLARRKSQEKQNFAGKVVSALRFQFGGHELRKK
jgi:6-phosphogluconate dehydrogenase